MAGPAKLRVLLERFRGDPDTLMGMILDQSERLRERDKRIGDLERQVKRLQDLLQTQGQQFMTLQQQLEEQQRAALRPAAPFRIPEEKRKTEPKKPGRPEGHPGKFRPRPDHVDEFAEVPLPDCPRCQGPVHDLRPVEQFLVDIPPIRPHVTRLLTYQGRCPKCGPVESRHPLQVSSATGAAATHLGPRALGVALELTHRHSVTLRKTCRILEDLFGLRLSPGGLSQAAHRMGAKLDKAYKNLTEELLQAPVLHTDETSWYVGDPSWSLWVFASPDTTLYKVCPSRSRAEFHKTVPPEHAAVLVSDCLAIYDNATPLQQKCYAHHQKAISQAIKRHPKQGEGFLIDIKALLKKACELKANKPDPPDAAWLQARRELELEADRLLAPARSDPDESHVANRLRKQRDHLLTFLYHEGVPATNNLAERQLRPGVISRKLSCGNRTKRGAHTWEVLTSLAVTAVQRASSLLDLVVAAARDQPLLILAGPAAPNCTGA